MMNALSEVTESAENLKFGIDNEKLIINTNVIYETINLLVTKKLTRF